MKLLIVAMISMGSFVAGRYSVTHEYQADMQEVINILKKQVVETEMVLMQSRTLIDYIYEKE